MLTVCVGNICRSPAAALLLQRALGDGVDVSSAGTHAVVGAGVHPAMAALLAADGVAPVGRARQLTPELLRRADLVLALTRDLRTATVRLAPGVVRRTFTLPEFAALSEGAGPLGAGRDGLVEAVAHASARRSSVAGLGAALDVQDPYGGSQGDYERAFAEIRGRVEVVRQAWASGH